MELFDFLSQLARNNNRQWFNEHRAQYDEVRNKWLDELGRLIAAMSQWEPSFASLTPRQAAFRIYRDTRFSLDKSPYKVFFSASFPADKHLGTRAAYYLQMDIREGESGFYGGVWCPDTAVLNKLRHAIVDNIEEWEEILADKDLQKYYPGWLGNSLKTIPKGWDRNHPQAEYLRLKDIGKFNGVDNSFFLQPDWPEQAALRFKILKPFIDFLNYSIDEE